jgi:hypothetical protein
MKNQNKSGWIDNILQDGQQQIPPALVNIETIMVSKTLPAVVLDSCF